MADRLYLPTADGGAITDAVTQSVNLARTGAKLAGAELPVYKGGAKYHFSFPGSLQGFQEDPDRATAGITTLRNIQGHSKSGGRSLALRYRGMATGKYFGAKDELQIVRDERVPLSPGAERIFAWRIPETGANPIAKIGLELRSEQTTSGYVFLDYLTWDGAPDYEARIPDTFPRERPMTPLDVMGKYAWVNGIDHYERWSPETFRLIHDQGRGLLITGTRDWQDYRVAADVTPHLVKAAGIGLHVQGMKRYKAFLLGRDGTARLVSAFDGEETVLAEAPFPMKFGETYDLEMVTRQGHIACSVNGNAILEADGGHAVLCRGGVALIVEEGRTATHKVQIRPAA